jgi:hypothetical protein
VPVVSADIGDFRDMAADESMAISFYRIGDAVDLGTQLIGLLESPDAQRWAAEQNYAAAIRMTMPHVVRHYLRWFELERRKRTFDFSSRNRFLDRWRHRSLRSALHGLPPDALGDWVRREAVSLEEKVAPESAGAEN